MVLVDAVVHFEHVLIIKCYIWPRLVERSSDFRKNHVGVPFEMPTLIVLFFRSIDIILENNILVI
jgi:hypothetical protein